MIGQLIQRQRQVKGLTQTELARRTGLSQNYISKLEGGKIDLPQRGTLDVLGGALGVPIADFYRAAGVMEASDDIPAPAADRVTVTTRFGTMEFSRAEAIAYVESKPDRVFRDQLTRQKARRSRESYEAWLLKIYVAWTSNADLAVSSAELDDPPLDDGR